MQTPNLVGPRARQLQPRVSVPLAVRHDHSHHLAIGLADHEYAHPEFALEFAGHPVRLRDADLSSDADRILDHPVTGVAEITPR